MFLQLTIDTVSDLLPETDTQFILAIEEKKNICFISIGNRICYLDFIRNLCFDLNPHQLIIFYLAR